MNKVIHEELLSETYPAFKDVGYELHWINSHRVGITWNYGMTRYTEFDSLALAEYLNHDLSIGKALQKFIYSLHQIDALEAASYGTLGFSSTSGLWEVSSIRSDDSVSTAFMDSFTVKERQKIRASWTKQFRAQDYSVVQKNLLIEISSNDPSLNPVHCLHSLSSLKHLLKDVYDVTETTEILLNSETDGTLLIGHRDAVERLCEVPGNEYCRKTYKLIEDELWSDNVT